MIQEMLHNALKHAKATKITVTIRQQTAQTSIEIKDNGIGFDVATLQSANTGIGLKSMEQRCKVIHATFAIHSSPGNGTAIQLQINNN